MEEEVFYTDLLSVPFKKGGRDKHGMDCYGLCIEMCRRTGKNLVDFTTTQKIYNSEPYKAVCADFVKQTDKPVKYGLIEYHNADGELHIGFILNKTSYIHATLSGVRISPLIAINNPKYYEVL